MKMTKLTKQVYEPDFLSYSGGIRSPKVKKKKA